MVAFAKCANSWILLPPQSAVQRLTWTSRRSNSKSHRTQLFESNNNGIPDITGKDIYQRVFYRLSPLSQVDTYNNIIVEERVRFKPDKAKGGGYLKPMGLRTLILRDGQVEEGEIGDEIFTINVKEDHAEDATHRGAGNSRALETTIATLLFVSANPKFVEGNVLEVGCDLGLAGLLGSIGAGKIKLEETPTAEEGAAPTKSSAAGDDDILSIPKGTPLSDELKMLTLTDPNPERLDLSFLNVKHSNVPSSKVSMEELNWRKRSISRSAAKVFHTIIASDLDYTYPEAKELAHTVAHRLEAVSSWEIVKGDSKSPPTFLHVCPDAREEVTHFHRFLTKGYRMNVNTGYLKLEKLIFVYQMLPESEPESKLDDLELEVQEFKESVYQSLTAQHHPDYAEGAGEYFFPMETGEYDSAGGSTYLEPDAGRSGPW
jgi:hypothetical protein